MTTEDHEATVYQFTPPPPPPPRPGGQASERSGLGHPAGTASPTGTASPASQASPGEPSGSAKPRGTRRRTRVTKTAAGLAVVLGAGAGAGAVITATSSGGAASLASASAVSTTAKPQASSPTANPKAGRFQRNFFWGMGGPFGPGMRPAGGFVGSRGAFPGNVVHASYTVKGPSGTYETLDTQVGTVQAVSSSSITVKSADGYSQQYAVGSSTVVYADYNGIGSVKLGDQVSGIGLAGSSAVTAERIVDITQVQANSNTWQPRPPAPPTSPSAPGSAGDTTTGYNMGDPFPGDGSGPSAA